MNPINKNDLPIQGSPKQAADTPLGVTQKTSEISAQILSSSETTEEFPRSSTAEEDLPLKKLSSKDLEPILKILLTDSFRKRLPFETKDFLVTEFKDPIEHGNKELEDCFKDSALPEILREYYKNDLTGDSSAKLIKVESLFKEELDEKPDIPDDTSKYTCKNLNYICLSPTVNFLNRVAKHYKGKYEIEFEVCSVYKLEKRLKKKLLQRLQPYLEYSSTFVIIVTSEDGKGHVTPLLCDFNANPKYACTLDVLPFQSLFGNHQSLLMQIKVVFEQLKLPLLHSRDGRQVDRKTCRMEAPVISRNALLYIREVLGLFEPLYSGKEVSGLIDLPLEWDYIDQVTNKLLKKDPNLDAYVLLDDLKKEKDLKKKKLRTVREFRYEHTKPVRFEYSAFFEMNEKNPLHDSIQTELPDNCRVVIAEDRKSFTVYFTRTQEVNTYMYEKGLRYILADPELKELLKPSNMSLI